MGITESRRTKRIQDCIILSIKYGWHHLSQTKVRRDKKEEREQVWSQLGRVDMEQLITDCSC